ncbi:alkyl hydroperoxide reductase subunit F [Frateuria aurantia]
MLDSNLKTQLKAYLEKVTQPIEIVASLDDGPKSAELRELLQDLAGLSDKVAVREEAEAGAPVPSFAINNPGRISGVRFAGIPLGHEFTSLVLALLQVGGHPSKLGQDVIAQIKDLPGPLSFETYFSLSCQNCPDVVQALNLMSVLNPGISHTAIDGAVFPEQVEAREIMSVPTIYLNGQVFGQGRMGVEEIVSKLDSGAAKRDAARLAAKETFDVLVVGGGPAGAAAAIYAARKGIRTGVVAERFGGQVLDTMAIENFISVQETEGPKLGSALEEHVKSYDVDIMNLQRASSLSRKNGLIEVGLSNGAGLKAKSVVISTGARWRQMNVPGEEAYRNKGVAYCPHCDGPLFKGKRVAVIGGGNSGVEAAIDLAGIVSEVTLIEFGDQLRADAVLQKKLHSLANVKVLLSTQTTEVLGDGSRVNGLAYQDRTTGEQHALALEGIFVQIGLVPNTEWLQGVVELSPRGEIIVDDRGQTSVPGVFAAGDATTVPFKQIVIAMGEGAKASLAAFDYLIRSSVDEAVVQDEEAEAA